jgi:hypothetical protein
LTGSFEGGDDDETGREVKWERGEFIALETGVDEVGVVEAEEDGEPSASRFDVFRASSAIFLPSSTGGSGPPIFGLVVLDPPGVVDGLVRGLPNGEAEARSPVSFRRRGGLTFCPEGVRTAEGSDGVEKYELDGERLERGLTTLGPRDAGAGFIEGVETEDDVSASGLVTGEEWSAKMACRREEVVEREEERKTSAEEGALLLSGVGGWTMILEATESSDLHRGHDDGYRLAPVQMLPRKGRRVGVKGRKLD